MSIPETLVLRPGYIFQEIKTGIYFPVKPGFAG
jgi:hypothetical protein